MLETIRQYAHEKLVESGLAKAARQRHLQYYLELAENVGDVIHGPDQAYILERLETELDNLRLALAWSLEGKGRPGWEPEPGLRLASALKWFWHCRGRQDEGVQWLELLLAGELEERGARPITPERTRCRAKALSVAAWSAGLIDEPTKFTKWSAESQGIFSKIHNDAFLGYLYIKLCEIDTLERNYFRAAAGACEALSIGRRLGDVTLISFGLLGLGKLALLQGNTLEAAEKFDENLAYFRKKDHKIYIAESLFNLGLLAWAEGDLEQARRRYTEVLINCRAGGIINLEARILCELGKVALAQGEASQARSYFEQVFGITVDTAIDFFHVDTTTMALEAAAALAEAQGHTEHAARLLGVTEAWHKRVHNARTPRERQERESLLSALRAALGEEVFTTVWQAGQVMTMEQAIQEAKDLADLGSA